MIPCARPSPLGVAALAMRHALTDAKQMAVTNKDKRRLANLELGAQLLLKASLRHAQAIARRRAGR